MKAITIWKLTLEVTMYSTSDIIISPAINLCCAVLQYGLQSHLYHEKLIDGQEFKACKSVAATDIWGADPRHRYHTDYARHCPRANRITVRGTVTGRRGGSPRPSNGLQMRLWQ